MDNMVKDEFIKWVTTKCYDDWYFLTVDSENDNLLVFKHYKRFWETDRDIIYKSFDGR